MLRSYEYPIDKDLPSVILSKTNLVSKQNQKGIGQCKLLKN